MREQRDSIDGAIDETAQALTAAAPPNLRARVAERIARPRRAWPLAWPAIAAAAAIVLAVSLWPVSSRLKPAPTTVPARTVESTQTSVPVPSTNADVVSGFSRTTPVAPLALPPVPVTVEPLSLEAIEVGQIEIPALPDVDTLAVERLDLAPISME